MSVASAAGMVSLNMAVSLPQCKDLAEVGNRWPAMVTCVSFVMAMQRRYVLCLRRPTSGRCTLGCVWMMCSVSERDYTEGCVLLRNWHEKEVCE